MRLHGRADPSDAGTYAGGYWQWSAWRSDVEPWRRKERDLFRPCRLFRRLAEVMASMIIRGWIEAGVDQAAEMVAALRGLRPAQAIAERDQRAVDLVFLGIALRI